MYAFIKDSKAVCVFLYTEPEAPIIYLNTFLNEGQKVYETAQATGCPPFTLVIISDLDWNHDMVPWNSPPVFKNADPCTGGADDYLRLLTEEIIPTAEKEIGGVHRWVLSGRAICAVRHLSDRFVLPCGQHVRLSLVSGNEGVYLLP